MRSLSLLLAVLLTLTLLVPSSFADQECADGDEGCTDNGAGNGNGTSGDEPGSPNATDEDGDRAPDSPPGKNRTDPEERRTARQEEVERRKAEARNAWREGHGSTETEDVDERRADALARLPAHVRERIGLLVPNGDDGLTGTYLAFEPDAQLGVLHDVRQGGTTLFEEVYVPLALGSTATATTHGKEFVLHGDAWSFRMSDDTNAPMSFRTAGDPFMLVLPTGASATPTTYGLQVDYVRPDGQALSAHLGGDAQLDPLDPTTILVPSRASFFVSAENVLLPQAANVERAAIEDAISRGRVGAEMTVVPIEAPTTFVDAVRYEDMSLELEESSDAAHGFDGYTLTVDSESHVGKTIVLNFAHGLIDPENLVFRYFNVEADQTVEAAIREASSLEDVLDPLDDGTVAEYRIVQDADGTQVLVSIPHFSVHQIQLMSLVDLVVEKPSLVLGTVGAVLLVAVATAGMFRRPEER